MDINTSKLVLAAAGGSASDSVYVDDLFSTYLWEGNGGALTINNGIDLAGKGGLVWIKQRSSPGENHTLIDTERGQTKVIMSSNTYGNFTSGATEDLTSFNSNGFSLGPNFNYVKNFSGKDNVSWTFRKAPGFFDIVEYSGTGSAQNIAHSLGSVPGMIIIRCQVGTHDWEVYHRSTGPTVSLHINQPDQANSDSSVWNNTAPTSTQFTVGSNHNVNQNGHTYIAYIFAHDDAQFGTNEDESIIKCGSYTGVNGEITVTTGFEPQWVLVKNTTTSSEWAIFDNMRPPTKLLFPNQTFAESNYPGISFSATGFVINNNYTETNASGGNYIYMAIRRPHKPPTAGTEVFETLSYIGSGGAIKRNTNILVDLVFSQRTNVDNPYALDRVRGGVTWLPIHSTDPEQEQSTGLTEFGNNYINIAGGGGTINYSSKNYILSMFKRAPGFMDVVTYKANNNTAFNVNHNLGVAPELVIIKNRTQSYNWLVGSDALTAWGNYGLTFNTDGQENTGSNYFTGAPTSTQIKLGTSSAGNWGIDSFIAYLFATLPGISKVGSFSGTGNAINVDCGFTNGARFVLIKRTDAVGDWYVWNTVSGIVSGNDPYLLLNTTDAEVTNTDYIDPLNTGFTVTSSAPAALNASGGTYLFLAIA